MSEADAVPHGVTRAEFPALSAVLSGYFHQDFDLDHPDWASAVAEIASDLPWGEVVAVLGELSVLCAAEGDDETFAAMVIRLGAYHLEYRGTRAWLIGLRDLLSAHAWSEHEAAMTPASTARVPDEELTFGPDLVVMHDGAPFTGVAFEETPDGVVSECAYVEGYQDGVSRDLYPEGTIKATTEYRHGERHGLSREYGPDGGLVTEESYERGVRLWAVEVSPDGTRVVTFRIDADGATSQHLARLRARESAADRRPSPSEGGEGT